MTEEELLEHYEKELKHKYGNRYGGEWYPDSVEIALLKESGEWETLTPWIQRQIIQEGAVWSEESIKRLDEIDDEIEAAEQEILKEEEEERLAALKE
jgi:hypothetical protein